jgi:hypothetical protein
MAMRPPAVSRRRRSLSRWAGAVQAAVEGRWQQFDGVHGERDLAGSNGGGVALGRLSEHHVGVVDAIDIP